jgi:hypothetical protein
MLRITPDNTACYLTYGEVVSMTQYEFITRVDSFHIFDPNGTVCYYGCYVHSIFFANLIVREKSFVIKSLARKNDAEAIPSFGQLGPNLVFERCNRSSRIQLKSKDSTLQSFRKSVGVSNQYSYRLLGL